MLSRSVGFKREGTGQTTHQIVHPHPLQVALHEPREIEQRVRQRPHQSRPLFAHGRQHVLPVNARRPFRLEIGRRPIRQRGPRHTRLQVDPRTRRPQHTLRDGDACAIQMHISRQRFHRKPRPFVERRLTKRHAQVACMVAHGVGQQADVRGGDVLRVQPNGARAFGGIVGRIGSAYV